MTVKNECKLSMWWHLANGALGAILAASCTFVALLFVGRLMHQPFQVGETLGLPFLGIACCCTIAYCAKRTAKRLHHPESTGISFMFGLGFHLRNIATGLFFALYLTVLAVFSIWSVDRSLRTLSVLMFPAMFASLMLAHILTSVRAQKRIRQKQTNRVENKPPSPPLGGGVWWRTRRTKETVLQIPRIQPQQILR